MRIKNMMQLKQWLSEQTRASSQGTQMRQNAQKGPCFSSHSLDDLCSHQANTCFGVHMYYCLLSYI